MKIVKLFVIAWLLSTTAIYCQQEPIVIDENLTVSVVSRQIENSDHYELVLTRGSMSPEIIEKKIVKKSNPLNFEWFRLMDAISYEGKVVSLLEATESSIHHIIYDLDTKETISRKPFAGRLLQEQRFTNSPISLAGLDKLVFGEEGGDQTFFTITHTGVKQVEAANDFSPGGAGSSSSKSPSGDEIASGVKESNRVDDVSSNDTVVRDRRNEIWLYLGLFLLVIFIVFRFFKK